MITCCSICDAPMTVCHSDMVCTSCGHSYRFKNFPVAPVACVPPAVEGSAGLSISLHPRQSGGFLDLSPVDYFLSQKARAA